MSYKFKKKPTTKEIAGVTIDLGQKLHYVLGLAGDLEKALSLYIEMNGHSKKFTEYIKNKIDEQKMGAEIDYSKASENSDGEDILSDTKDERSGSETVREKTE